MTMSETPVSRSPCNTAAMIGLAAAFRLAAGPVTHEFMDGKPVATMLLNLANLKESYANYQREYGELYGQAKSA